ncbi:hypothetical protein FA13DRAFT_1741708 [Coprinellus micaceus]|uniref:Uncharacterized protein n=1 Tax=Coprinellus micaceus TaxID=71717 RepID=A0A4Y7SK99_COPMI|nr:hypothetical protein FA13DRAFT_1741708 [Coprinellus micaceus]
MPDIDVRRAKPPRVTATELACQSAQNSVSQQRAGMRGWYGPFSSPDSVPCQSVSATPHQY